MKWLGLKVMSEMEEENGLSGEREEGMRLVV